MSNGSQKAGLMRSLGVFVGEIVKAVKTDPGSGDRTPSNQPAENEEVVLRRTTTPVDEVVVRKNEPDDDAP